MYSHYGFQQQFVGHEPCPKCGSKDNLGRWADGHAHCFGCGYYERAERSITNARKNDSTNSMGSSINWAGGLTTKIPPTELKWLRSYGITDEELLAYDVRFDEQSRRLILPCDKPAGTGTYQGRYFGPDKLVPRFLTFGPTPHSVIFGGDTGTRLCVFVEDWVSAVKVARVAHVYPVLGSNVPLERFKWALGLFEKVVLWLDPDMKRKSVRLVLRAQELFGADRLGLVFTDKDPKYYSTNEIKKILHL